jgi:hypothetical protein
VPYFGFASWYTGSILSLLIMIELRSSGVKTFWRLSSYPLHKHQKERAYDEKSMEMDNSEGV